MITEKILRERRREFELIIENQIGMEIVVGSYKALQREAKVLEASSAIMRIDKALESFGEPTKHEHPPSPLEDTTDLPKEKGKRETSKKRLVKKDKVAFALISK